MSNNIQTSLIIVGSGPAALTASVYAGRAKINHLVICGDVKGGQLITSPEIENFPSIPIISGFDLMLKLEEHAKMFGANLVSDLIKAVDFKNYPFVLKGELNTYTANAVILATGSKPNLLGLPQEKDLIGKGISYCATCDGNFYKNQDVAVVGGGNTAVEDALYLANIVNKVTLIHRRDTLRAEKILQERLFNNKKIEVLWHTTVEDLEINEQNLSALKLYNNKTKTYNDLSVNALFIAIGHYPNTGFLQNQLELDTNGYIITKSKSTATSIPGVFAAGDVQEANYKQAIISAGSGAIAALEAGKFLINC